MPSREQLVDQLHKLQNLAQRAAGTPEGVAARRKLRELMQLHGITVDDLKPPRVAKTVNKISNLDTPTSPPATITLKVGSLRIRWKL